LTDENVSDDAEAQFAARVGERGEGFEGKALLEARLIT